MIRRPANLLLPALFLLALTGPALGQSAVSALKGHDTGLPVDVEADRIEVQDRQDRAIFSGNVRVRQGDLTMTAARLRVAYRTTSGGGLEVLRIDADGGVRMESPSERARGNYGIYDVERRLFTMIGDVTLDRGSSSVRGQRLVIDLDNGRSTLDGGSVGGEAGRVTGRFTVPKRGD